MIPSPPASDALVAECCRLDERELRGLVREWLASADFELEEDGYVPAPRPGGACPSIRNLRGRAARRAGEVQLGADDRVASPCCCGSRSERPGPWPLCLNLPTKRSAFGWRPSPPGYGSATSGSWWASLAGIAAS